MEVKHDDIKNSKRGRPASTGSGEAILVRLHPPLLGALDAWKRNSEISRPEAIRQLLTWALTQNHLL